MQEVAEGHAPQTLVVDEIGAHQEVRDVLSLRQSGLQLIASVRCQSLLDILQNPTLKDLVGGVHERPSPGALDRALRWCSSFSPSGQLLPHRV